MGKIISRGVGSVGLDAPRPANLFFAPKVLSLVRLRLVNVTLGKLPVDTCRSVM